jgi:excisionase family DNA binding protein
MSTPDDRVTGEAETSADVLGYFRAKIASAPLQELPAIRGQLAALDTEVFCRFLAPAPLLAAAESPTMESVDRLLTVDEAALVLNQKPQWVRKHQDELGVVRMGRSVRFSEKKLEAYIRRRSLG